MTRLSGPRVVMVAAIAAAAAVAVAACSPSPPASTVTSTPSSAGPDPATSAPASPAAAATTSTPAAACTTSAAKGSCGPYTYPQIEGSSQDPTVGQDVWGPVSGWQQTLVASTPGRWRVAASMPAGNTAVVSYPNTGASYGERPLSAFTKIYSSFSETMNATGSTSAWATYDLWFNNWNDEVMIQHDFAHNGECPSVATAQFGGTSGVPVQDWHLCQYGSELIWKLGAAESSKVSEQSGSVDILSMITWLESHGYLPAKSTVTDLSYGFEICSTGGQNENFQVSSFSITAS